MFALMQLKSILRAVGPEKFCDTLVRVSTTIPLTELGINENGVNNLKWHFHSPFYLCW